MPKSVRVVKERDEEYGTEMLIVNGIPISFTKIAGRPDWETSKKKG